MQKRYPYGFYMFVKTIYKRDLNDQFILILLGPSPTTVETCYYQWLISPLAFPGHQYGSLDPRTRTPHCEKKRPFTIIKHIAKKHCCGFILCSLERYYDIKYYV